MTRKFDYENELQNYYLFNEKGHRPGKENTERQLRKSLGKEKISNICRKGQEFKVLSNKI